MPSKSPQVEEDRRPRSTVDEQLSNDVHLRVIAGLRNVQLALADTAMMTEGARARSRYP